MKLPGNLDQCIASMLDCHERLPAQGLLLSRMLLPFLEEISCIQQEVQLRVLSGPDWISPVVPLSPTDCWCTDIHYTPETSDECHELCRAFPRLSFSFGISATTTLVYKQQL